MHAQAPKENSQQRGGYMIFRGNGPPIRLAVGLVVLLVVRGLAVGLLILLVVGLLVILLLARLTRLLARLFARLRLRTGLPCLSIALLRAVPVGRAWRAVHALPIAILRLRLRVVALLKRHRIPFRIMLPTIILRYLLQRAF